MASPISTVQLSSELCLTPRIRLHITIRRADLSLSPLSSFLLKSSLSSFLKSSLSTSLHDDLDAILLRNLTVPRNRIRPGPVAVGEVFVRDFGFLEKPAWAGADDAERRWRVWRDRFVSEMDGIELNLEGVRFRLGVVGSPSDDFEMVKREWEQYYAGRGSSRRERQQPDTLVLRGLPSRWFAETRVSSKPSMLVTHTILSTFGKIRNLSVAEDDDFRKNDDEDNLASGLHCKIVVQYEKYSDFEAAMKALCGRSLQKQGSRLKANYEVSWERDGFRNAKRNELLDRSTRTKSLGGGSYRSEAPRRQPEFSRYSPDSSHSKRYRAY